jgi:DNA-binding CsgD family transcriptional regulator
MGKGEEVATSGGPMDRQDMDAGSEGQADDRLSRVRGPAIRRAAHAYRMSPRPLHPRERELLGLSERQVEILMLMAVGRTGREIARDLILGENTVKSHTRNLYERMGVSTRTEAAIWVWSRPDGWWNLEWDEPRITHSVDTAEGRLDHPGAHTPG